MGDLVTWVVTADGARARVYEERQRLGALRELADWGRKGERHLRSGQDSSRVRDRIGRASHTSLGQSAQDRAEAQFLSDLAQDLDDAAEARRFDRLVLIAPAKALGALRNRLTGLLSAKLEAYDSKDLVAAALNDVRHALSRARAREWID